MFPSRPPDPLGPPMAPVTIYEESIEDQLSVIDSIKAAHKQRVAEWRLHPRRKRLPKKKCGPPQVPRRVASPNAMDLDTEDIPVHPSSSYPWAARRSLSHLPFVPVVLPTTPRTPTAPRPVPEEDGEEY